MRVRSHSHQPLQNATKWMSSQNLQREAAFADTLGQPSNTEAELLASGHIEIKGKQFLAQTTRVKVSEWRRGSFLV